MAAYTTLPSTHIIEGRSALSSYTPPEGQWWEMRNRIMLGQKDRDDVGYNKITGARKEQYRLIDEARAKIKPIADFDAEKSERRKKAAKRRMGGRLGTILTETLG